MSEGQQQNAFLLSAAERLSATFCHITQFHPQAGTTCTWYLELEWSRGLRALSYSLCRRLPTDHDGKSF